MSCETENCERIYSQKGNERPILKEVRLLGPNEKAANRVIVATVPIKEKDIIARLPPDVSFTAGERVVSPDGTIVFLILRGTGLPKWTLVEPCECSRYAMACDAIDGTLRIVEIGAWDNAHDPQEAAMLIH